MNDAQTQPSVNEGEIILAMTEIQMKLTDNAEDFFPTPEWVADLAQRHGSNIETQAIIFALLGAMIIDAIDCDDAECESRRESD